MNMNQMQKNKRTTKELFAYADKLLNVLTEEEKDRVRRYLNYKFKHRKNKKPINNTYG